MGCCFGRTSNHNIYIEPDDYSSSNSNSNSCNDYIKGYGTYQPTKVYIVPNKGLKYQSLKDSPEDFNNIYISSDSNNSGGSTPYGSYN